MVSMAAASSMTGASNWNRCVLTRSGVMTAQSPRISAILQIFEPTTLPRLMSALPAMAASTLTTSSGALVAKATSVSPMSSGESGHLSAMRTPPRTRNSAP